MQRKTFGKTATEVLKITLFQETKQRKCTKKSADGFTISDGTLMYIVNHEYLVLFRDHVNYYESRCGPQITTSK